MAQQEQVFIEFRTTWVFLAFKSFCWLRVMGLIKILDNAIIARIYVNGKMSQEIRFNFTKKQMDIRVDSPGGKINDVSDLNL